MKTTVIGVAAIGLLAFSAFTVEKTSVYKINVQKSTIEWNVEKKGGTHNGTLSFSGGSVTVQKKSITGSAEIDMNTIKVLDIQDEANRTKLETHLRGEAYFDAAKFPKASFVITSVTPIKDAKGAGPTHTVKGNLTIKDKTNEVSFDAVISMKGNEFTCTGTIPVDHAKFNIAPDNKNMKDTFDVKVNIVATK